MGRAKTLTSFCFMQAGQQAYRLRRGVLAWNRFAIAADSIRPITRAGSRILRPVIAEDPCAKFGQSCPFIGVAIQPLGEFDQRSEKHGACFVPEARLDDQAAELDLLACVLFSGVGFGRACHALRLQQTRPYSRQARWARFEQDPLRIACPARCRRMSCLCEIVS